MSSVAMLMFVATVVATQPFDISAVIPSELPGRSLVTRVTFEAFERCPPWSPAEPNPPVSARKALALAEKEKARILREMPEEKDYHVDWHLQAIKLVPLERNRWYWEIEYWGLPFGGLGGVPFNLNLVVLMDGTLVQPEEVDANWPGLSTRDRNPPAAGKEKPPARPCAKWPWRKGRY